MKSLVGPALRKKFAGKLFPNVCTSPDYQLIGQLQPDDLQGRVLLSTTAVGNAASLEESFEESIPRYLAGTENRET